MKTDQALAAEWKTSGDLQARNELVMRYMPAVFKQAMKYPTNHLVMRYDLIQEGVIGLIKAVDKYDLSKGTQFWTCAYYYVMDAMYNLANDHLPTAGGYTAPDRAGDNEQDGLIDEITAIRLAQILKSECSPRENLAIAYKCSGFTTSKGGLADTQIKRAYESAITHLQRAVLRQGVL